MVAGRLDGNGRADDHRRAELWRAGCDDAARRRSICLFARSLQSVVGISLRLDAFSCHSNRHDRGRRGRVLALSWCARAGNFANAMDHSADYSFAKLRDQSFDAAIDRSSDHRAADLCEHARSAARQTHPKRFHFGENFVAVRVDCSWNFCWSQCRRCGRQLQRTCGLQSAFLRSNPIFHSLRRSPRQAARSGC